jgi:thiol-disulfide isomerase/thioredoxin
VLAVVINLEFSMRTFIKIALCFIMAFGTPLYARPMDGVWSQNSADGQKQVKLYFFWSKSCPHCNSAKPFVEKLGHDLDWLALSSHEVSESPDNGRLFKALTEKAGDQIKGVPAFLFCGEMVVGFDREETSGKRLMDRLLQCRNTLGADRPGDKPSLAGREKISLPILGEIDASNASLPVFTIIIAGLDAFNPCAFFVLLLLLSLIANVQSRRRMLLVGGIFVFFSGLVYFMFMALWLNLFLVLGELKVVTLLAATLTIGVSIINIKDYFWYKQGVSLSIPEGAKPGLYQRIRLLVNAPSLPVLVFGTVVLAVMANTYELLCTSGFPMIFTRVLTLRKLTPLDYYLYLALYNLVYVIPLAMIVLAFCVTLGSRKLSEEEGRMLKLISGLMMLGLGLCLWFTPEMLGNVFVAAGLLGGSILLSVIIFALRKKLSAQVIDKY